MRHGIWRIAVLNDYGIVIYRTNGKLRRYPITLKRDDSRYHRGSLSRSLTPG